MIALTTIAPNDGRDAYQWHRGFSSSLDLIFPRSEQIFQKIVMDGHAWSARNDKGDYLGLAYAYLDDQQSAWELGGLMVAMTERGKRLGSVLMRLTLGHLLFEENPLAQGHKIIAHVLKSNPNPRGIIKDDLKFNFETDVEISASKLPGLRANAAGFIEGDEFHFVVPDGLTALAGWLESWDEKLNNGERVEVILRPYVSLKKWAAAFRSMAEEHG